MSLVFSHKDFHINLFFFLFRIFLLCHYHKRKKVNNHRKRKKKIQTKKMCLWGLLPQCSLVGVFMSIEGFGHWLTSNRYIYCQTENFVHPGSFSRYPQGHVSLSTAI